MLRELIESKLDEQWSRQTELIELQTHRIMNLSNYEHVKQTNSSNYGLVEQQLAYWGSGVGSTTPELQS